MTPIPKKSSASRRTPSATRGRKPPTPKQAAAESAQRRADGQRLLAALNQLGLSQSTAASGSGIRQSHLNEMVNGTRKLGRDDLRRLAAIGVSCDFVLGIAPSHVSPGQSRSLPQLQADLAQSIMTALDAKYPGSAATKRQRWRWIVHPKLAYDSVMQIAEKAAAEQLRTGEQFEAAATGLRFLELRAPEFREPLSDDERAIMLGIEQLQSLVLREREAAKDALKQGGSALVLHVSPKDFAEWNRS